MVRDKKTKQKIPLAPMGVLAQGSVHARPSARPPIDASGNFPACLSAVWSLNISPTPLKVESEGSVSYSGIYFKLAHFPVKIGFIQAVGGGSPPKISLGILIFLLLGSPYKISEPYDMPFWVRFEIWPFVPSK